MHILHASTDPDLLVGLLLADDCELYEEYIKKLLALITQQPLGSLETRKVVRALDNASHRGKHVRHLRGMFRNRTGKTLPRKA